jgi:putative transposase
MRFAFIAAEQAHHSLSLLCRCLRVTRSGFYAWRNRPASARQRQDGRLKVLIRASFDASHQRYGSPRLHRDLRDDHEERVSRKRVIRLMQEEGLQGRAPKRFVCTTDSNHQRPVAANLLNREFSAEAPNRRWVGDTTELKIGEGGTLYLAAIVDLFSRFVVGWAISAINDRHLALAALTVALNRRCPEVGLLHHSDRGSTYASEAYQDRLAAHGITCSMSRTGNCYDNAVMEAFFSTLKTELADAFASHGHAKRELFDYIEAFYNTRRRHSTLDYVSPAEFERRFRSGRGNERCA